MLHDEYRPDADYRTGPSIVPSHRECEQEQRKPQIYNVITKDSEAACLVSALE